MAGLLGDLGISLGLGGTTSLTTPLPAVTVAPSLTLAPAIIDQAPINLGPLTTTFTPPAACALAIQDCKTCTQARLGKSCDATNGPMDVGSCWPGTSTGAPPAPSGGFYSPGLACPAGHAVACTATGGSGGNSGWPLQFKLGAEETAVGCCPSYVRSTPAMLELPSNRPVEASPVPTSTARYAFGSRRPRPCRP